MSHKWVEINKASEVLDLELEYLCDLVIKGSINTTTCEDTLLIDISELSDNSDDCYKGNARSVDTIRGELEKLKLESAWLKSENMMNSQMISDYHEKFAELKEIQKELVEVINHQSETIRVLRGYHPTESNNEPVDYVDISAKHKGSFSIWMFLPIVGLCLAAMIEVLKKYHIHDFHDLMFYLGWM